MFPHLYSSILASYFVTIVSLLTVSARVDLGGAHMGIAMGSTTCPTAHGLACTELGDDWPDMGLACPEAHHDIPRHTLAMMSVTLIQIGRYKTVEKKDFPINECYTIRPNATVASYGFISQGSFDMWFFAHDKCDCRPNQTPVCHDRATEAEKCNLRTFTLCKVTKKTEICKPKHHPGWKPSTETDKVDESEEPSTETDTDAAQHPFDPAHRQQSIFYNFSNFGWNLMEIFGLWGVV